MEEQRVRIRDIADELGVSTATVSNVIHGKTQKISDETVRRVLALLEERRYIPSMAGILLAQNDSRIIGVFVNDHEKYEGHTLDDAFIASSLNFLSDEIEAQGLFMMVKKARRADEILRFASMWNMEGLVVIGFCHQDYAYLREHMRIPFIVYDGFCEHPARIVNITIDNFGGGQQVGALFSRLGHRRAICITDNLEGVDRERIAGFRAGFTGETEVLRIPMHRAPRWEHFRTVRESFRGAAVFAVSDYYAADLIAFLHEAGLRVPEDTSVAGFDDTPLCALTTPALTTVRQDGAQRAHLAVEMLRALRAGEEDAAAAFTLPVTLIERGSTGCARE